MAHGTGGFRALPQPREARTPSPLRSGTQAQRGRLLSSDEAEPGFIPKSGDNEARDPRTVLCGHLVPAYVTVPQASRQCEGPHLGGQVAPTKLTGHQRPSDWAQQKSRAWTGDGLRAQPTRGRARAGEAAHAAPQWVANNTIRKFQRPGKGWARTAAPHPLRLRPETPAAPCSPVPAHPSARGTQRSCPAPGSC